MRVRDKKVCEYCKKNSVKRNANRFCSKDCTLLYQYEERIKRWKAGKLSGNKGDNISNYVRRYIFEKYDNQCVKCSWNEMNEYSDTYPLHVHHIDSNYKNTVEENLTLLCPNCHSLTKSYGSRNKGKGREGRRRWRREKNAELA